MKVTVRNKSSKPLFMPGGKLSPGHEQLYDIPANLVKQLESRGDCQVTKATVKKKKAKK